MAKFCTGCGAALEDDKKFCTLCGAAQSEEGASAPAVEPAPKPQPTRPIQPTPPPVYHSPPQSQEAAVPPKGSKYDPITTWGYIGITLLMCIPVIGLVLMIVWACGKCKKIAKRNFARAMLIMLAVSLVISLILAIAGRALVKNVANTIEQESSISVSGLLGGGSESRDGSGSSGGLGDLLGGLAGMSGSGGDVTNEDIEDLEALGDLLDGLGALTGEDGGSLDDLIDGAIDVNKEAEAANDGWPKSLRAYPGGTANATASYRTEITGTSLEEMMDWIDELKKDGFVYQDFYDFGMTEEDMLGMNGWWAYDGETYLSVSYSDGTVIVDHTKELPDLSGLLG